MQGERSPQIMELPAAGVVEAKEQKALAEVSDISLVLASSSEKALNQLRAGALELIGAGLALETTNVGQPADSQWTHDYALIAKETRELGLNAKMGAPASILRSMELYARPLRMMPSIEFLPT